MKYFTRTRKALFLTSAITIFFVCCKSGESTTSSVPSLTPGAADVTTAQTRWKSSNLDELTKGYNTFMDKCTQCHGTKNPQDFSESDWNNILPDMGRKATLDSTSYSQVMHYILARRQTILAAKK